MRYFQTVLAILMAAMVNMAHSTPGTRAATAMLLATALVDGVASSGFQHSVVAAPGHFETRQPLMRRTNQTGGCFHDTNFTRAENDTSAWIPWAALANQYDAASEMALFYTFTALCKEMSATMMSRDIPVSFAFLEQASLPSGHFSYHV
jgi:hypothetical protein